MDSGDCSSRTSLLLSLRSFSHLHCLNQKVDSCALRNFELLSSEILWPELLTIWIKGCPFLLTLTKFSQAEALWCGLGSSRICSDAAATKSNWKGSNVSVYNAACQYQGLFKPSALSHGQPLFFT